MLKAEPNSPHQATLSLSISLSLSHMVHNLQGFVSLDVASIAGEGLSKPSHSLTENTLFSSIYSVGIWFLLLSCVPSWNTQSSNTANILYSLSMYLFV